MEKIFNVTAYDVIPDSEYEGELNDAQPMPGQSDILSAAVLLQLTYGLYNARFAMIRGEHGYPPVSEVMDIGMHVTNNVLN